MRYQIMLENTNTGEKTRTNMFFSSLTKAKEWGRKWKEQGDPFNCVVIDTKKDFVYPIVMD